MGFRNGGGFAALGGRAAVGTSRDRSRTCEEAVNLEGELAASAPPLAGSYRQLPFSVQDVSHRRLGNEQEATDCNIRNGGGRAVPCGDDCRASGRAARRSQRWWSVRRAIHGQERRSWGRSVGRTAVHGPVGRTVRRPRSIGPIVLRR